MLLISMTALSRRYCLSISKGRRVMRNRFLEGVFLFELVPPGEMQVGLSDRETLLRFGIARKSIGS
jgi:hypothetical protein